MGANSNIEWTDATVNFWWGCTEVSPGCDNCYARTLDKRYGGDNWNGNRKKIKSAVSLMHRLDNQYAEWAADVTAARGNAGAFGLPVPQQGVIRRVFVQSMSDLFDNTVPLEWFAEAWATIVACRRIHIQVVTKRLPNLCKRLYEAGAGEWPKHVGLMVSTCTQEEVDRDVERLVRLKETLGIPWVGISAEPLLKRLRLPPSADQLEWVIVGGESGHGARKCCIEWIRDLVWQCGNAKIPVFVKQMGASPFLALPRYHEIELWKPEVDWRNSTEPKLRSKKGGDPAEWPSDLRDVRQFPEVLR